MTDFITVIGSANWDVIARSARVMQLHDDMPGTVSRHPGGVGLNIALKLVGHGAKVALVSAIGRDALGDALTEVIEARGIETRYLYRTDRPTDTYIAVEAANGLVGAIFDARSLEAVDEALVEPLAKMDPPRLPVVIDGNLTETTLAALAAHETLAGADLRLVPASPGKAERLRGFVTGGRGLLYCNTHEARVISGKDVITARDAADALLEMGAARVLVTDGSAECVCADPSAIHAATPPPIETRIVTGAGDSFMAGHIMAEIAGLSRQDALEAAIAAAQTHMTKDPT
ncbi:PfkB family carbohydrate kinase [Paracoccaceae bacterium GXU_MW_L88]